MFRLRLVATVLIIILLSQCQKPKLPSKPYIKAKYDGCITGGKSATFEIATFNAKKFPLDNYKTVVELAELVKAMDVDIIAFQEISSKAELNKLDNLLDDFSSLYYPINNSIWNLAYVYKTSEISIDETKSKVIFDDDSYSFPRPPFEIHVTHKPTAKKVVLLNNHLKCCNNGVTRRRKASEKLYQYINSTYPNDAVIVLGDLNDDIDGLSEKSNVFWSFVNDPANYKVADMSIALGDEKWWSYPSWPSHIDHFIITNELFSSYDTCIVLKPDACFSDYPSVISDHRPLLLVLK